MEWTEIDNEVVFSTADRSWEEKLDPQTRLAVCKFKADPLSFRIIEKQPTQVNNSTA